MGEKDYDNRDFSDLSDSNQEKLKNASPHWNRASDIRGNDGYNPNFLSNAENGAISSGRKQSEKSILSGDNYSMSSPWINKTGGTHKSRNQASSIKGSLRGGFKNIFKKRGAVIAASGGGLILTGGIGLFSFLTVGLAPIHIQEIITEKLNSSSRITDKRNKKLWKVKAPKGVDCKFKIWCKFQSVSDKQLDKLKKAGFEVEVKGKTITGKNKISSIIHTETGTQIDASNIKNQLADPRIQSSWKRAYSGKFTTFRDKIYSKVKGWFGLIKAFFNNKGKTTEQLQEENLKKSNGDVKTQEKATGENVKDDSNKDEPDPKSAAEEGTAEAKADLKNAGEATKGKNLRTTLKAKTQQALDIAGKAQKILSAPKAICYTYTLISLAFDSVRTVKIEILSRFAMMFLSFASKTKTGDATTEEVQMLGNSLMGYENVGEQGNGFDKDKVDDDKQSLNDKFDKALSYLASTTSGNEKVKSATESKGWRALAYNDSVGAPDDSVKNFSVGVVGWLADIVSFLMTGTIGQIVRAICKVVVFASLAVDITMAVLTVVKFILECLSEAVVGCVFVQLLKLAVKEAALQAAKIAIISYVFSGKNPLEWVIQHAGSIMAGDFLNKKTIGEDYGNALMSGSAALMHKNTTGGGGSVLSRRQAIAYYQMNEKAIAEDGEYERQTRSPFDPTTRHTFFGSIISNMLPHYREIASIGGFFSSLFSISNRSLATIMPGADAASAAGFAENMNICQDKAIVKPEKGDRANATDIFCNTYTGLDTTYIDYEPEEVAKKLIDGGHIEDKDDVSDVDSLMKSADAKKYKKLCYDRSVPIGSLQADDDDDMGGICNTDNDKEHFKLLSVFLTDVRVQNAMDDENYIAKAGGKGSSLKGNSSISDRAIELAWEDYNDSSALKVSDKQKQALKETGLDQYTEQYVQIGASCDAFVTMVMRTTVDKDYPCCGVATQTKYLQSHPEKYQKIETQDVADLKPGDIMVAGTAGGTGAHTWIYVEKDGQGRKAEGGWSRTTGNIAFPATSLYEPTLGEYYSVYRWKG